MKVLPIKSLIQLLISAKGSYISEDVMQDYFEFYGDDVYAKSGYDTSVQLRHKYENIKPPKDYDGDCKFNETQIAIVDKGDKVFIVNYSDNPYGN